MEIVSKVSRGSKMDQIYIPKNRSGFDIGNYVIIRPLETNGEEKKFEKPYFYGVNNLESIKLEIVHEVLRTVNKSITKYDNVIITGSFLEEGFHFNDIDILIVTDNRVKQEPIKEAIERKIGIEGHILILSNKELVRGLETDPLYQMMLSRCVAKRRFLYKTSHILDYKLLDLHLIKSKTLLDNFDILSGKEKYGLVRNMVAIYLYLEKNKVTFESVDEEIKKSLEVKVQEIKDNVLDKKTFLKKYKLVYDKSFAMILKGVENGSKQK